MTQLCKQKVHGSWVDSGTERHHTGIPVHSPWAPKRRARFFMFTGELALRVLLACFVLFFPYVISSAPSKTPKASSQCWAYMSSLAGATLRARARLKKEKSSSLYAHSPLSLWSCAAATAATAMGSPSVSVSHSGTNLIPRSASPPPPMCRHPPPIRNSVRKARLSSWRAAPSRPGACSS